MSPTIDLRRPGWKKISPSSRHLVHRHGRRQLRDLHHAAAADSDPAPPGPRINPGEERLFSSYVPGLETGPHSVVVAQDITAGSEPTKEVQTTHIFNVIGPRFALPDNAIDSFYPPPGHADRAEVVPHMVFNDPTLPWERIASWASEKKQPDDYSTNRVPWLAVLLFTQDELRLDAATLSTIFTPTSLGTAATQSPTLTVNLPVADVPKVLKTASSVLYDPDSDGADTKADFILVQSRLFNALFAKYGSDGQPDLNQTTGWVQPHRFLAHLRHIHLDGTAAAATTDDDDHAYSVVIGNRIGPLDITQPTTVVAHLVNIEGVEAMSLPVKSADFVAMTSLYSWSYTCLPPKSLDIGDAFEQLGDSREFLRPVLTEADQTALAAKGSIGARVSSRLHDGFSMVRYRLQTGEISAAFFRGPFTPTVVNFPAAEKPAWPATSTTGTKLQVLDDQLNIMDLTYSAAWTLGKTLALADQAFANALARVRKQIFDVALNKAQLAAVKAWAADLGIPAPYRTREEVISTIADTVKKVGALPKSRLLPKHPQGMLHRWHRPEPPMLDLKYKGGQIDPIIDPYLEAAAAAVAASSDGTGPYNEFNVPASPEWAVVLKWVMDRYFLVDVPPHYLIPDAGHLPRERLRFFYVDLAWVHAMVDGGLSLANHLDQEDDRLRDAIKGAINTYLTTVIPGLGYEPPLPVYGFLMRSALVTKFPDMVVDLKGTEKPGPAMTGPPVILRHEVIGPDTLLGLLRETPVDKRFTSLLIREPPHQQYYSAGKDINPKTADIEYQRVYTVPGPGDEDSDHPIPYTDTRGASPVNPRGANFLWSIDPGDTASDLRLVNVENFALDAHTQLIYLFKSLGHPDWYTEPHPSAALMGIQLNEPCWQLEVQLPYQELPPDAGGLGEKHPTHGHGGAEQSKSSEQAPARMLPLPPRRKPGSRKKACWPARPPVACAPHPAFGDRARAVPMPRTHPAPHSRIPRVLRTPLPAPPPRNPTTSVSGAPVFTYLLYPVGAADRSQSQVPMLPGKQDLIFSIVMQPDSGQTFDMLYMSFTVPLSRPAPLVDAYGAVTMLSNLRFNVIAQPTADGDSLLITLKPRGSSVLAARITEMSFLLSGVIVHPFAAPTTISIPVAEAYVDRDPFPNSLNVLLVPSS